MRRRVKPVLDRHYSATKTWNIASPFQILEPIEEGLAAAEPAVEVPNGLDARFVEDAEDVAPCIEPARHVAVALPEASKA